MLLFLIEEKIIIKERNNRQLHERVTRKDKKDKIILGCLRQARTAAKRKLHLRHQMEEAETADYRRKKKRKGLEKREQISTDGVLQEHSMGHRVPLKKSLKGNRRSNVGDRHRSSPTELLQT